MRRRNRLGQTLVFGLFFLMPATLFVAMIVNVSFMIEQKQRLQLSADRAAAAGALMKADVTSALAWINLAQADLQAQMAGHAVNTSIAGTLAEIEDWGLGGCEAEYPAETAQWSALAGGTQWAPPSASIGGAGAISRYNTVYTTATTEIAAAQAWSQRLKNMQANLAALGQELIKREVFRTALVNMGVDGNESTDGLVHINLFPYTVYFAPTGDSEESWRITQQANGGWLLEGSTGRTLDIQITDSQRYIVTDSAMSPPEVLDIQFNGPNDMIVNGIPMQYFAGGYPNLGFPAGSFQIYHAVVGDIHLGQGANGGMQIAIPLIGVNEEFRTNPFTGDLEQYVNGTGWTPLVNEMDLGGLSIPAQSNTITIQDPNSSATVTFTLEGGSVISISGFHFNAANGRMWYEGSISPLCRLNVYFPGTMNINGWRVPEDASGQWLIRNGRRERLSLESPGVWVYEIATVGGYTRMDTNTDRFGVDQVQGIFGDTFGYGGTNPAWLYDGRIAGPGWYDLGRGAQASQSSLDSSTHYHRTVECWHPLDMQCPLGTHANGTCPGNGDPLMTSQLDGGWHDPLSGAWVSCPLCEGTDSDSNGATDVRRYPESNIQQQNDPIRRSRLRNQGDNTNWDIGAPVRLVLTDEFFRWGINVAVHSREYPWDKFLLPNYFADTVNWSPIATASARVGFVDPDNGQLVIRFADDVTRDAWIDDSWQNLMITDWVAVMVSTRAALRLEDLELDFTYLTNIPAGDSGAVALLKHYLDFTGDGTAQINQWRRSFDDRNPSGTVSSARQGLNRDGANWQFDDPNIDAWIKH